MSTYVVVPTGSSWWGGREGEREGWRRGKDRPLLRWTIKVAQARESDVRWWLGCKSDTTFPLFYLSSSSFDTLDLIQSQRSSDPPGKKNCGPVIHLPLVFVLSFSCDGINKSVIISMHFLHSEYYVQREDELYLPASWLIIGVKDEI